MKSRSRDDVAARGLLSVERQVLVYIFRLGNSSAKLNAQMRKREGNYTQAY